MFRLFIAINLPQESKDKLQMKMDRIKSRYHKMNIRFTSPEQWHFTLVFLGYQEEKFLSLIKQALKDAIPNIIKPLAVDFDKISYGPPGARARMIWLKTTKETSIVLNKLKNDIEKELEKSGVIWKRETRPYQGHLTLARFPIMTVSELPNLEDYFKENFKVKTVDLMKSTLRREGAEYERLSSVGR